MRILFVDELPLRRAGFARIVEGWAAPQGLEVDAVNALPPAAALESAPYALIVLALSASSGDSELSGVLRTLGSASCPTAVISDNEDPETIRTALRAGVRGYIPSRLEPGVAMQALSLLMAGGTFFPPSALLDCSNGREQTAEHEPPRGLLTPRQYEVLRALREGKSNKMIARHLKMRESTVKVHVHQIMRKLGATNRTQAALSAGLDRLGTISKDGSAPPRLDERIA